MGAPDPVAAAAPDAPVAPKSRPASPRPGAWAGFVGTLGEVLRQRQLVMIVVVAVLFYAFYYPAPYAHQTAQQLPVVVADEEGTPATRAFIAALSATREVAVVATVGNFADARRLVQERQADGIVLLPRGLTRGVLAGEQGAGIGVWVNGAYLTRASGIGSAVKAVVIEQVVQRLSSLREAVHGELPIDVVVRPLFNPREGYASYVFPAVSIIILQQTLLFGAAMLAAQRRAEGRLKLGAGHLAGTLGALVLLGVAAAAFMFGWAFWAENMPRKLQFGALALVVPLFALSVAALGTALGSHCRSPDQAMMWLAPTSVPLFFLSGASWPLAQMPAVVSALSHLSPATLGIHLFVPLNQMGATLADLGPRLGALAALALAYTGWAAWRCLRPAELPKQ